jgi:predicted AAA+ superfamily ATPase
MEHNLARQLGPVAVELLSQFPALIIEGARQVGKSTLTSLIAPGAPVVNLDLEAARAAASADPQLLLGQASTGPLVIDELQRLPGLALPVKAAIDADRRPGKFIITGSASLLRLRGMADSLAGRVARLTLYGLSQGELREHADDFVTRITQGAFAGFDTHTARDGYAQMLAAGSYPDAATRTGRSARAWFDSYLDSVLVRDLSELRKEYSPQRAQAVARYLAANPAGELVAAHISRATGIPAGTVTSYTDLLESVDLLGTLRPWTPNLTRRESGRRKAFFLDSGLALRMSRMTSDQLLAVGNLETFGRYLEAFAVAELLRQQTWSGTDYELYHYRDRDGLEVDAIAELEGGTIIGIEVKASTTFRGDDFNNLRKLRDRLGHRFQAGIVLNTSQSAYTYADRLFGLPVCALWEL